MFKSLILGIIIVLIILYLYIIIKKENFYLQPSQSSQPISGQLTSQIASKLGVSVRRIQNIVYNGDVRTQSLSVSFTILDTNVIELQSGEPNLQTAANNANNLFNNNQFTVQINNVNIMLDKINKIPGGGGTHNAIDYSSYFNNTGLQDVSKFAEQSFREVPNDPALTRFYNLKIDNNYKINPVLE
jgi:hypothetical protein